ncbi:MAG: glycosyltransferase [Ruminococcus sp.]|nr:glycosyltransferase [Ruminococcus sp.]
MHKPRILEVNKFYPPHIGGIETLIQMISEGLQSRSSLSVLVCRDQRGGKEITVQNGIRVHACGSWGTYFSCPLSFSFFPAFFRQAKQADVIHFHTPFPLGDLACLLSRYQGRVVISWHSDVVKQKRLRALYLPIMRRFLDRADAVIVATQGHIDSAPELIRIREKCHIIPYGICSADYLHAPRTPYLTARAKDPAAKKVFFAGRLVYYKGVDVLLEAFAKTDGCELFLAGEGGLEQTLRERAEELAVSDRVHFLGRLPDTDLKSAFADCDLFVLPSVQNSEAFGIVQLEAMVYGKPVINTSLPTGVPCVSLDGQTGLTVPPGDADALRTAIQTLVNDDALRRTYGAAAKQRVLAEFERDKMLDRIFALLTNTESKEE